MVIIIRIKTYPMGFILFIKGIRANSNMPFDMPFKDRSYKRTLNTNIASVCILDWIGIQATDKCIGVG